MALSEKRTQLYLPKEQWKKIMKLAKERRISFAELTREALAEYLERRKDRWKNNPITKHLGCLDNKDTDLAENHDHYIYD